MTKVEVKEQAKTEQDKVRELYGLIGTRGLYVSTNFDVFSEQPEPVPLAGGAGYKVKLIKEGSRAYASPLLFATLTSLLNHGTMLITGSPGIGKTTGAEFAGHFFTGTSLDDILVASIKGHPQLTEEKMIASYNLGKLLTTGERDVEARKFLQCPVKILDEGNRMPADTLSIIMDLVDRGRATYGGEGKVLKATPGPLFMTANYADEGTFQFTPPFLDRFDVATMVTSPQPWDLAQIRARGDAKLNGGLEDSLKIPKGLNLDFEQIRKEIRDLPQETEHGVPKVSALSDFLYGSLRFSEAASRDLSRATKGNAWMTKDDDRAGHFNDASFQYTINELSIRTVQAMDRYARAFAWLNGDREVTTGHLKTVLPYLLWHKIEPSEKAIKENPIHSNDRIGLVKDLTERVETDYNELLGNGEALKNYSTALRVLQTGQIGDNELEPNQIRTIARNAIATIGAVDKPYAITLANHIAAEYNQRVMNGK
jgi:MoxR-like ATPase